MSIIGNPIMAGASGPAASIFVTGLSETDTVTATKGSKTLTGKWTHKPNPEFIILPDGYTQLEYIESTGTQYINTGVNYIEKANIATTVAFTSINVGNPYLVGYGLTSNSVAYSVGVNSEYKWRVYGGTWQYSVSMSLNQIYDLEFGYGKDFAVDGSTIYSLPYISNDSIPINIFGLHRVGSADDMAACKLYSFTIYDDTTKLRDFIPAKRNSDSAIGLYDLVSNSFFENAGTGTFIAGAEIPQTIGGFLISKIKDYGTWTVTATDGSNIATQDVLVDVITEYEIEMSLSA